MNSEIPLLLMPYKSTIEAIIREQAEKVMNLPAASSGIYNLLFIKNSRSKLRGIRL